MKRFVWRGVLTVLLLLTCGVLKTTNEARAATVTDKSEMTIGFYGTYPINPPKTITQTDKDGNRQLVTYDVPDRNRSGISSSRLPQTSESLSQPLILTSLGVALLLISERIITIEKRNLRRK